MTESNGMAFAAIITISLPDSSVATELNVTLLPSDLINKEDGSTKPLQDCTLGELLQFANNLEDDLWSGYQESNLLDLVIEGGAEIEFEVTNQVAKERVGQDFWLEHLIVIGETKPLALEKEGEEVSNQEYLGTSEALSESISSDKQSDEDIAHEIVTETELQQDDDDSDKDIEPARQEKDQIRSTDTLETDSDISAEEMEDSDDLALREVDQESFDDQADVELIASEPESTQGEIKADTVEHEGRPPEIDERPALRILGRRRPLNHPTWTSVDILINEPAFRNSQAHALSSLDREVAGVLVGPPPEKQPDGRYLVHISDTIIAKHTRMHGASVTYTPESWRYINDKLAEMYPANEAVIIGWYHTHPGFGIFLSGMDQFIHQNFFTQTWHIALVLDPLAKRSGFFCWDRQLTKVDRYDFPWPEWAKNSW
jgi:proteasome lid subunit RPN8/RPN11